MSSSRPSYPARLGHEVSFWVHPEDREFHIRIRQDRSDSVPLTDTPRARALLSSARFYHENGQWGLSLFLVMPDHIHALLHLPSHIAIGRVIGSWKQYHSRSSGVVWQSNFFDHRLRNERSKEEKWTYIRRNPVASGLCAAPDDWPWWMECGVDGTIKSGYE